MATKKKTKEINIQITDKISENIKGVLAEKQSAYEMLTKVQTEFNKVDAELARLMESVVLMGTKLPIDGLAITSLDLENNVIVLDEVPESNQV